MLAEPRPDTGREGLGRGVDDDRRRPVLVPAVVGDEALDGRPHEGVLYIARPERPIPLLDVHELGEELLEQLAIVAEEALHDLRPGREQERAYEEHIAGGRPPERYEALGHVRLEERYGALRSGNIEDALVGPVVRGLIAYNRWDEHGSATVIVNTTPEPLTARVRTRFGGQATLVDLLSGERFRAERPSGELAVHMPARSARILVEERHDYEASLLAGPEVEALREWALAKPGLEEQLIGITAIYSALNISLAQRRTI